jgi:ketosteroid isomerase-like protein
MIEQVVERWHAYLRGELADGLDDLLDDDVVFLSPIVYTPQRGRAVTTMYLEAAARLLAGDRAASPTGGARSSGGPFRYTKTVVAGDTAVLEFESTIGGTYVNGVDIITGNEHGRIIEFRVMIRPLRAIELVHRRMAAALEKMTPVD